MLLETRFDTQWQTPKFQFITHGSIDLQYAHEREFNVELLMRKKSIARGSVFNLASSELKISNLGIVITLRITFIYIRFD